MLLCNISSIWWRLRKKPNCVIITSIVLSDLWCYIKSLWHAVLWHAVHAVICCPRCDMLCHVSQCVACCVSNFWHDAPNQPLYLRFTPPPNFQIFILLFILLYYIVTSAAKSINVIPIISSCHIKQKNKKFVLFVYLTPFLMIARINLTFQ